MGLKEITKEDLKKILKNHKKWLNGEGGERADLHGADLRYEKLRNIDLRKADLSGANLSGADLGWADLRGANLSGVDLSGADLRCCLVDLADVGYLLEGIGACLT